MDLTTIQLTDIEARAFVRFQKHRALIDLLEQIKAFDIKSGKVTISFDAVGAILAVTKEEHFKVIPT